MKVKHNLKPISTAEKLWFANKYIKLLKDEVKSLKEHEFDELVDIPREVRVSKGKDKHIKGLEDKNRNIKRINEGLLAKVAKLELIIKLNELK